MSLDLFEQDFVMMATTDLPDTVLFRGVAFTRDEYICIKNQLGSLMVQIREAKEANTYNHLRMKYVNDPTITKFLCLADELQ